MRHLIGVLFFFCLCGLAYGDTVTVTWNQPETVDLKDFDLRVNETDIVNIPEAEVREWSGNVTLVEGSNVFDLRARNLAGDVSAWSEPAYYDKHVIIVDNGDTNTSSTGTWTFSGGVDPYGENSLTTMHTSTYSFEAVAHGTQKVSLWWTEWDSRSAAVSVKIYDGSVLLDTVIVDQTTRGGQWNVLGVYTFYAETAKVTILSEGNGYSVCADAVKFTYLPVPSPCNIIIIGR